MKLESERLVYKKATEPDRENYLSWYTSNVIMRYITGKGMTDKAANARFEYALDINNKFPELGFYSANNKEDNKFIGIVKLVYYEGSQAEIGYGLMPEYWGKKYASEMLKCFVDYSKRISKINELIAIVDPQNIPSKKVLTKLSFTFLKNGLENERPAEYFVLSLK
ncbi:MAG: GNAT family N-acetyltransferase [Bacteroidetes bacterium]|nr:GNAT family N-acetyltransferase [Bacteroidota bacterium]